MSVSHTCLVSTEGRRTARLHDYRDHPHDNFQNVYYFQYIGMREAGMKYEVSDGLRHTACQDHQSKVCVYAAVPVRDKPVVQSISATMRLAPVGRPSNICLIGSIKRRRTRAVARQSHTKRADRRLRNKEQTRRPGTCTLPRA